MEYSNPQILEIFNSVKKDLDENLSPEEINSKYLGKKGLLTDVLRSIGTLSPNQKAIVGRESNILKKYIEESIENLQTAVRTNQQITRIDVTAPYDVNTPADKRPKLLNETGSQHPLTKELENILEVFYTMGFNVVESRQLDNDYNMFEALNFPPGHPARDSWDTFWTEEGFIPPAHTSTMQNRILRSFEIPIRVVIPGRCFRNEATDASHEHTLHQIEGVYVDKNISFGDMIGTIKTYLEGFFGKSLEVRLQPAFFPFTEPDAEFLISCPFCNKTGCSTCGMSGWMEIMGCGMIHPYVLREGGINPDEYSGFAWGFGLDRLVMVKNAIKDIRWLHSGDTQFLKQFVTNY